MIRKLALAVTFVGCIVAANYVTSRYGLVSVGFGLVATAGTYLAGLSFVIRDALQDVAGKLWVIGSIAAGAAVSFAVSLPQIALASALAFALSELADFAVYTPLREGGYLRAAIASNVVGAFVDSVVFLAVAGFPVMLALPGQMVGKLTITLATVLLVVIVRAVSRQPMHRAESASSDA